MGDVGLVTEYDLQAVLARFQLQGDLGLAAAEMAKLSVGWQGLVQVRQFFQIDHQVMMARVLFLRPGGGNAHPLQAKADHHRALHHLPILGADDIGLGILSRGRGCLEGGKGGETKTDRENKHKANHKTSCGISLKFLFEYYPSFAPQWQGGSCSSLNCFPITSPLSLPL